MKLHSIRQDLQGYQDFFSLVQQYPVHLACPAESGIDPVKKGNLMPLSFFFDQTGRPPEAGKLFRPEAALNPEPLNP